MRRESYEKLNEDESRKAKEKEAEEILLEKIKNNLLNKKINPKMPGFKLLVEACYKYIMVNGDNTDNIYLLLGKISVIPVDNNTGIGKEKLFMKQVLEEAGIKIGILQFVRQVSEEVCKIHK